MDQPRHIIGIGASAGGLDALKRFFSSASRDHSECAFLIVQHLDPDHESLMVDLLSKSTNLSVRQAEDGTDILAGFIYVIPPGKYLRVRTGKLRLSVPTEARGMRKAVDALFKSLADEHGDHSVGVVLSGTGSDGADGLRAINASGGFCAVEDPETAEHSGMPTSAVQTGEVHLERPAEELLDAVLDALDHPYGQSASVTQANDLDKLLAIVKVRTGTDFRHYKHNTIARRVARRMSLRRVATPDQYVEQISEDDAELHALCSDLLIGVTSFFRDQAVFRFFRERVATELVEQAGDRPELRVWIAGCATGEEAYTVAMLLLEQISAKNKSLELQVFASDIDEASLAFARAGVYSEGVIGEIPAALLGKYFKHKDDGSYEAGKQLRECIIFANQNLLADPPFSRIDLVTCRNVLIYLKSEVQDNILSVFHFALRPGGFLMLGGSESIGRHASKFRTISRSNRVFKRTDSGKGALPSFPINRPVPVPRATYSGARTRDRLSASFGDSVNRWVNERFAPAAVVINRQHEVVYYSKKVHRFLTIPEGEPTHDVCTMLDSGASTRLRGMISRVFHSGQGEAPRPILIKRAYHEDDGPLEAKVGVLPFEPDGGENELCVITFEEVSAGTTQHVSDLEESSLLSQLEQELKTTREDLQSTIEEMETTNEELKASNEEAMSVNEELQSANEELETSKEELQSLNEELSTVNSQLRDKLEEVEAVTNDMTNLLASTDMGVLFLDAGLQIKRFTPKITDLYRIVPADMDRPVGDIVRKFQDPDLEAAARRVLQRLDRDTKVVHADDGKVYRQSILPYRTQDSRIEGVVITYADVTELSTTIDRLERVKRQQSALSQLGALAIDSGDIDDVLDSACRLARGALDAELAKVLRLTSADGPLVVEAGVGWEVGVVGVASVPIGTHSQAGFTLESDTPIVVEDLESERRFSGPELLTTHGVRSGISCCINANGKTWGVFGVHSRQPQNFSEKDVDFILSIASVVGQSIERESALRSLRQNAERLEFSLEASEIGAWEYRISDRTLVWNEQQRRLLGAAAAERYNIDDIWEMIHPDDRDALRAELERCIADRRDYKADFRVVLPSGEVRWLHGAGSVYEDANGETLMYGVNFDITARKVVEQRLQASERDLQAQVSERGRLAEQRLAQIRRMTHEMVVAESDERRRLAGELHDNLGQLLNLALLRLSALSNEGSNGKGGRVEDIVEVIKQASEMTRSITGQLSPQVLGELGLPPALEWLGEEIERVYDIKVEVRRRADPIGLSHAVELILYRAVRELLINVARHAGVGEAEVHMLRGEGAYRVEVIDAGRGFDVEQMNRKAARGYGLLGLRERISHIGGKVSIESSPGQGCFVTLEIPDPTELEETDDGPAAH